MITKGGWPFSEKLRMDSSKIWLRSLREGRREEIKS